MRKIAFAGLFLCSTFRLLAQQELHTDIRLSNYKYPFEVHYLELTVQREVYEMAYMDVIPEKPNGKCILLFHGKNFNGAYWETTANALLKAGYRVIMPDQVGFGKSSKPEHLQYSFAQLALNNKILLDSLKVPKTAVLGHSMGGMLATRFALDYPGYTEKLILENPIGLEDYAAYALTYDMILTQPVCYEFEQLEVPTLLIIGTRDRTFLGKNFLPKDMCSKVGRYDKLGKATQEKIKGARLVEIPDTGHLPHIERFDRFIEALLAFL